MYRRDSHCSALNRLGPDYAGGSKPVVAVFAVVPLRGMDDRLVMPYGKPADHSAAGSAVGVTAGGTVHHMAPTAVAYVGHTAVEMVRTVAVADTRTVHCVPHIAPGGPQDTAVAVVADTDSQL